ncbi:oxysterol-binding protein-related protein 8-like [Hyposmocoma kahamanoa]|uniref:oxysterol-binding protein-related protein 8-like n=1 Tax=Hyposmocoma kahamanoa TaxID=1477025 RepID=UPI000E6D7B3D|nr:oxysterol-binding protein-related protein 8-like [Hyposmocoma kahamanoa]
MKKLSRQFSEPTQFGSLHLKRKFSVDSALLTDYNKKRDVCDVFNQIDTVRVNGELAGAASDTDSEVSQGGMADHAADEDRVTKETERPKGRKAAIIERLESLYIEDPDRETGAAGELVEEVAEENKSLLWFLLKQVRPGMDLSKVVLPTFILEPRSFLDKLSDNYYHADMLTQAQTLEDPYLRFKCVLRWYLSGLYRKPKGLKKPYNPVLGESFRCRWKHKSTDNYTYYIAEQVSHHPPMSAFYVSNRKEGYIIEGSLLARSKFYGNSTSAILEGGARVHLLNWGETYFTTAPYAHCKGIVIGTLSMELGGKIQVICQETGYHADVEFKLRSFLGSSDQTNAISGRIKKGKDIIAAVEGYWDGRVEIKDKKTGVAATEQKTIIEERQRELARSATNAWTPRFFHKDSSTMPPEGLIDHGWRYNYVNTEAWQSTEVYEYEEDFVIRSLSGPSISRISEVGSRHSKLNLKPCKLQIKLSDSESHDDVARRSKTSSRTLKQSLHAIDASLREQTIAIERLSKTVESLSEGQRTATQLQPRSMATTHGWDLFGGFVLAIVLQALLNWMFYNKD